MNHINKYSVSILALLFIFSPLSFAGNEKIDNKRLNFVLGEASQFRALNDQVAKNKSVEQKVVRPFWSRALQTGKSKKKYFPEMASPTLANGVLYVGTHSGIFYAIDVQRGKVLWHVKTSGPIASKAVVESDLVLFGNNKGDIYALNTSDGSEKWKLFVGGEILARPAASANDVYVVNTSREVSAIDLQTGTLRWSTYVKGFEKKITMRGNAPVILVNDHLFVGFADGQVVNLSLSGAINWSKNFAEPNANFWDVDAGVLLDNGILYVVGYFGSCLALSSSGQILWQVPVKSGSDISVDENSLILSSADGKIIAFDKKNGKRLWQNPLDSGALSAPLIMDDTVMVGSQQNFGFILSRQSGKTLQKFSISGGFLGNAVEDDSHFYFLSGSGVLRAFSINKM